jgi:thioredoxin reductase (NADPH)
VLKQLKEDGSFIVLQMKEHSMQSVASGLSFEPRKPLIDGINFYENKGIKYFIKDPED